MSQLQALLNVLQPTEISKVKKIRLIGKEKRIFDFIYSYRHKELPEVEEICKEVGITSTHFYKICSVLMDKLYDELVPGRGYELLYYLNRKDLYNHFTHEMLLQEKDMLKEGASKEQIETFYQKGYLLLQRVSAKNLDEDLILEYGKKYLNAKIKKEQHDDLMVRNSYLATKLYLLKATRKGQETSKEIFEELTKTEVVLKSSSNFMAVFYLNKAFSTYYNHVVSEPTKVIEYLNSNLQIIEKNKASFQKEEFALTKCKIAEMYYMNSEFERAFKEYSSIFTTYTEDLATDFYHHAKFAQVAMIIGQLEFAKNLIDNRFALFIESKQVSSGVMGCILNAKYYFFTAQYAEANKYIQLAKRLISKSFYLQYEFEIRILESMYFIMINDLKSAKNLLRRNVKFMNSKGFSAKNSEMIYVFIILQEIIMPEFNSEKMGTRLAAKYELMQKSYAAIYGKLLANVISHINKIQKAIMQTV